MAAVETQCGQRMRGHDFDPFGDRETGVVGKDKECGEATRARRFAGAREHSVDVGDSTVRDPGLLAVQAISISVLARRAGHGRDIGASLFLREREGGEPLAAPDFWQHVPALRVGSRDRDRAGTQALHGEGEVGEAVVISERLAGEADASRVDCGGVAIRRRDRRVEKARFAKRAREITARFVDVLMIDRRSRARSDEAIERACKGAMGLAEERPVEPIALI